MEILGNMYENKALRRNPESAPSLHFNFKTRWNSRDRAIKILIQNFPKKLAPKPSLAKLNRKFIKI